MKQIILALTTLAFLLVSASAFAVNTVTSSNGIITLSAIDSDYVPTIDMAINSIEFVPGAVNDVLVVRSWTIVGQIITTLVSSDGEARIKYFNKKLLRPAIDFSECTLTAGSLVIIDYESR